jgi:arabinogalactan oligomer/maltooligosaccharide transport system permease protein
MNKERNFALWMVMPAAIVVGLVVVWPFIYNVFISLSNMSLLHIHDWKFVGLKQYQKVFSDTAFYVVMGKTLVWTIINVTFHVTIGVALAVILHENVPGKRMFRTLLILPWAIPPVVTALTWRGLFHYEYGAVNLIWIKVFEQTPIQWLNDPLGTFAACVVTNVWLGFPFMMVVALGGLQSIPRELYEAAMIDGASAWQRFKTITLPMLVPVLTPAIVLGFVWTFNKVDIIWLVSNGGEPADKTHILVSFVYRAAFNLYRYGYAAAGSIVIFALLVIFSVVFMRRAKMKMAD